MKDIHIGKMQLLILHYIGNKGLGDGVRFSSATTDFEQVEKHFESLIRKNFRFEEIYRFDFAVSLELNPVYQFIRSIFNDNNSFVEQSRNCSRLLYENSNHPKIKGGELHVAYYTDFIVDGVKVDAIGLFKSENKEAFIKLRTSKQGFDLESDEGMSINKLDKGCLIFNMNMADGYLVALVDNWNRGEDAKYWKEDFFGLVSIRNEFSQTKEVLDMTRQFVQKYVSEELGSSTTDRIDLLNRSLNYFKSHENFVKSEFETEVLQQSAIIQSFQDFDSTYRENKELEMSENFEISPLAVKRQAKVFKSILKLDKNFHVYIHGDRELIEHGVERDGRKFYKLYYDHES